MAYTLAQQKKLSAQQKASTPKLQGTAYRLQQMRDNTKQASLANNTKKYYTNTKTGQTIYANATSPVFKNNPNYKSSTTKPLSALEQRKQLSAQQALRNIGSGNIGKVSAYQADKLGILNQEQVNQLRNQRAGQSGSAQERASIQNLGNTYFGGVEAQAGLKTRIDNLQNNPSLGLSSIQGGTELGNRAVGLLESLGTSKVDPVTGQYDLPAWAQGEGFQNYLASRGLNNNPADIAQAVKSLEEQSKANDLGQFALGESNYGAGGELGFGIAGVGDYGTPSYGTGGQSDIVGIPGASIGQAGEYSNVLGGSFSDYLGSGLDAAQAQYGSTVNGANQDLRNAYQDYGSTIGLATQQTQQNLGLLNQQADTAVTQAGRNTEAAQQEIDIQRQQADQEYAAAVAQVNEQKDAESEYLKNKLASAGALDSTNAITIMNKSSQKYNSMLSNMAGQRQIALSQFSLADTQIRNKYADVVENVAMKVAELSTTAFQALQQVTLGAQSNLRNAKTGANKAKQQAFTDYLSAISEMKKAQYEAEQSALEQSQKMQQQSFENAVSLAGLTGVYIDPVTGEKVLTLAGKKAQGGGGNGANGGTTSDPTIQWLANAIRTGEVTSAMADSIIQDSFSGAKQGPAIIALKTLLTAQNRQEPYIKQAGLPMSYGRKGSPPQKSKGYTPYKGSYDTQLKEIKAYNELSGL